MKVNKFAQISQLVITALDTYRDVRQKCRILDSEWHSRTIEQIAKPFIKGYFTLVVVGK